MLSAPRLAVLLTLPALALGACGGDDGGGSGGSVPDDPAAAVKAAGDALAKVPGFHFEGTQTDEDGPGTIKADVRRDGSFDAQVTQKGTVELRSAGGEVYLKADKAFWTANGDAQTAALLGDKWVKGFGDALGATGIEQFLPQNVTYCLTRSLGTLSSGGTGEVDGTPVKVIKDAGDKPGTSAGELSIATKGEPFPLRATQTAKEQPGGTADKRCGDDGKQDQTTASDVKLSDFGASSKIAAPAGAIDLNSLSGGAGAGTA